MKALGGYLFLSAALLLAACSDRRVPSHQDEVDDVRSPRHGRRDMGLSDRGFPPRAPDHGLPWGHGQPPPTSDLGPGDADLPPPAITCAPGPEERYCYSAFKETVLLCHCYEGRRWDVCKRELAPPTRYRYAYRALIDCLAKNCDRPCGGDDRTPDYKILQDCSYRHCRAQLSCCVGR